MRAGAGTCAPVWGKPEHNNCTNIRPSMEVGLLSRLSEDELEVSRIMGEAAQEEAVHLGLEAR